MMEKSYDVPFSLERNNIETIFPSEVMPFF